jgi:hypothetical protein
MGYIKWVDSLSKGLKVLFTIFANVIFGAYRIVREALAKNWNLMAWDIVFAVVWPVNWVMDLITILGTGKPFDYAKWFGATGEGKSEAKPAEEKKPEEKPAEEKPVVKPEVVDNKGDKTAK